MSISKQVINHPNRAVQIFVTGGTFDKDYNFITGELYFTDTHLADMLERGRCTMPVDIRTLMMIDSLEMTEAARQVIAFNCAESKSNHIVITHGTDTMAVTGQYLKQQKGLGNKTIVLTGAMIPYAFGSSSDGFFNLGSAMAFAQCLDPGIYICMNGQYWEVGQVVKNTDTGYFEPIASQ
ncbi:MAG: asparaginase domain-containing protein [Bacteroidota bacterium]